MTNLRVSFVSTSGDAVDTVSGATLKDTRIRAIHATGVGDFIILLNHVYLGLSITFNK